MLDDDEQSNQFLALTGLEGHKPLDCVGTESEMILSLNLLARQNKFADNKLMELARNRNLIQEDNWDRKLRESLAISPDHSFPPELRDDLLNAIRETLS